MRWEKERRSENVEDQRGASRAPMLVGGGLGTIVIVLIAMFLGADPMALFQQLNQGQQQAQPQQAGPVDEKQEELKKFVEVILASTEDVWTEQFRQMGKVYEKPTLVLFSGEVRSACGMANAAVGPFYCPEDRKVYIDLAFYQQLKDQLGAPGDFAQAYVIAHEVGHHVQNLLGYSDQVHAARGQVSEAEYNQLSVKLELQADFLAGVWARLAQNDKKWLDPDDIDEAINCAQAIGDDRLQREARGSVRPDSFTHGTSEQRARWFRRGFDTGDITQGDTFRAPKL